MNTRRSTERNTAAGVASSPGTRAADVGLLVPGIFSERRVRARRQADADAASD